MSRTYPARAERSALCDLLADVGPDQPTLCDGWTSRDLAAHLIVRERRPDAAIGMIIPRLRRRTETMRDSMAHEYAFDELITMVRRPPWYSFAAVPLADKATNTSEFFIHHEDLRRGVDGWRPRKLDRDLVKALHGQFKILGKLRLRKFPAKITINIRGYAQPIVTGKGRGSGSAEVAERLPEIMLTGDVGELTLFLSGRQRAAQVEIEGPAEATERLHAANLGF